MNYKLNLLLLIAVFSVVTYNVCMAYQNLEDVNVHGQFEKIGLLETPEKHIYPVRKPLNTENQLASLN